MTDSPRSGQFEAVVWFLTPQAGGRKTSAAVNGYRGQLHYSCQDWDAEWRFLAYVVLPERLTLATLRVRDHEQHVGLTKGCPFEIREGAKIVAHGIVTGRIGL